MKDQSTDFYRSVIQSLPFNLAVIDRHGQIIDTNGNWDEFGKDNDLSPEYLDRDINYLDICRDSEDSYTKRATEGIYSVLSGEQSIYKMEYPCHSDDRKRWFMMQVYPFQQSDYDYFIVNHIDITDRRLSEEKTKRLSAIVDKIPVCITTLQHVNTSQGQYDSDSTFVVTSFNPYAETVTGLDHEAVLGRSYEDVFEELFGLDLHSELLEVVRKNRNFEREEVQSVTPGGEERIWNLQAFNVTEDYLAIAFEEVTEEVKNRQRLEYLATYDELTGLPNRDHFLKTFRNELERAKRYDKPLSFLLLDLDRFKRVNDTYGHVPGDELLSRVGDMLARHTRTSDTSGRYGGEEFGLVLPETGIDEACKLAERLRKDIADLEVETEDGTVISSTCSIGVSEVLPDDGDIKDVLRRTDKCLYEAKEAGRNRVVCWKEE